MGHDILRFFCCQYLLLTFAEGTGGGGDAVAVATHNNNNMYV